MTGSFEVGASAPLRALHRLPWMSGPEGELHAHDYRIEVVVGRERLDERGMVCDLDLLNAALAEVLATREGRDLDEIKPEEAEAVTVEILAEWLHGELSGAVARAGGESLRVRVWEAPDAFGGYAGPVG